MTRRIRWQILIAVVSSLLVLILMTAVVLTQTSVSRPAAGGIYRELIVGAPQQLNPLVANTSLDQPSRDVQQLIFDGLLRLDRDGLPLPALAESFVGDDVGLVYTVTLRANVMWHDGAPLTADDALFTIRAIKDPAFAGDPALATVWRRITPEPIDDRSFRLVLDAPYAPLPRYATFPILPAHLLASLTPTERAVAPFNRRPVGTGPYRLDELSGERAQLSANSSYYRGRPLIDSVELLFVQSSQQAVSEFARGNADGLALPAEQTTVNPPTGVIRRRAALDGYTTLTFNLRGGPLASVALRQALARGLDRREVARAALGDGAALLDTPLLPGTWANSGDPIWYPFDATRAASDLDALGYAAAGGGTRFKNGAALTFTLITDQTADHLAAAEAVAKQWRSIGVVITVESVEPNELMARLAKHDFAIAIHSWQRLGPDPDQFALWDSSQGALGLNYAGLADDDIDNYLQTGLTDPTFAGRAESYAAFAQRWVDLAPAIILYQPTIVYDTNSALTGVFGSAAGAQDSAPLLFGREWRLSDIGRWSIRSAREIEDTLRR